MTDCTIKTSSDFGNDFILDIAFDCTDCLDDPDEKSLSSMGLRTGTGNPYTSVTESLNTLWQNMLKEKMQELDGIHRLGKSFTVTILGEFMGPETKRDILSIVGDGIDQTIFSHIVLNVHANEMSANRTEQNRTEQNRTEQNRTEQNRTEQNRTEQNRTEQIYTARPRLLLGRAVTSHNRKTSNLRVIRSSLFLISKSRNGSFLLCSGISVFKNPRIIDK